MTEDELERRRDVVRLSRLEKRVNYRLSLVDHAVSPWVRARHLAELADLLAKEETQGLLTRAKALRPTAPRWTRKVPDWVPLDLHRAFQVEARRAGEFAAAAMARRLKRERAGESFEARV